MRLRAAERGPPQPDSQARPICRFRDSHRAESQPCNGEITSNAGIRQLAWQARDLAVSQMFDSPYVAPLPPHAEDRFSNQLFLLE